MFLDERLYLHWKHAFEHIYKAVLHTQNVSQPRLDDECLFASVKPVITSPYELELFKTKVIHVLALVPKYPSYTKRTYCTTTSHHFIFLRAEI